MVRLTFPRLIKLLMVMAFLAFLMTFTHSPDSSSLGDSEPQDRQRHQRRHMDHLQNENLKPQNEVMEQLKIPQKVNKDVVLEQPVDQDHAEDDHVEKIVKKPEKKEEEEDDKEHDDEPETEEREEKRDKKLNPQPILMAPQEPQGDKNMKGYLGAPVVVDKEKLSKEDRELYDRGWKNHEFNEYVSNMIPLTRELPKSTDQACLNKTYNHVKLPDTSVILVFHNEAWSTLLRTVHSVINRSPPELLKEVILVDDFSDMPHLQQPLEDYLAQIPKAQIVRMTKRGGLTRARLAGAAKSTGEVLTFLDSHCECFPGWLEPLLERIALNPNTSVCPLIETIDDTTFTTRESHFVQMGGFNWDLIFNWFQPGKAKQDMRKSSADVLISPTMAGGLFSIHRHFFELIGTYDPQMDFWGGENMELSFKIWMCGGRLEFVPCSHVGHVFRRNSPHKGPGADWTAIMRNTARVAEVWLDEYKIIYSAYHANKMPEFGDVSSRKALRQKLRCKSFDWYLKTIYPERSVPSRAGAFTMPHQNLCLDSHVAQNTAEGTKDTKIIGYPCHGMGGTQYFELSSHGEIFRHRYCLDANDGYHVVLIPCHHKKGNQEWNTMPDGTIRSATHNSCLTIAADKITVALEACNPQDPRHIWTAPPSLTALMNKYRSSNDPRAHTL